VIQKAFPLCLRDLVVIYFPSAFIGVRMRLPVSSSLGVFAHFYDLLRRHIWTHRRGSGRGKRFIEKSHYKRQYSALVLDWIASLRYSLGWGILMANLGEF
jgi:hypothetical protein